MVNLNWRGKREIRKEVSKNLKSHPFRAIETCNYNQEQQKRVGVIENWENLLICGDNLSIMASLLSEFSGKINLIYIDPPFATGGDFNFKIYIGDDSTSNQSKRWINKKSYSDTWKEGLDSYLNFIFERLLLMKELLAKNGSIYVHLDWHVSHYIKIIMDEIFGSETFRNEIIWAYPAASVRTRRFYIRSFDVILFYSKSNDYIFNDDPEIYMEYSDRVKNALKKDDKGIYYYRGGSHNGKKLSRKVYVTQKGIFPRDVWSDIPYIRANTIEYQGFSTQKPEHLLKRIMLASTNKNDLVADFFCGSGTSLIITKKLKRRWIGCDSNKHAIHIIRKRLLDISNTYDIFKKTKKYSKEARPFKILAIKNLEEPVIFDEFFRNNFKKEDKILDIEKPVFKIRTTIQEKNVVIELIYYKSPYEDLVIDKIKDKIETWKDWIDYWSIDFNDKNGVFNNIWVSYRTPKKRSLKFISDSFCYDKSGKHKIAVKVIDIFGIETIKFYEIKIN